MSPLTDFLSALERGDSTGALLAAIELAAAASALYLAVLVICAAATRAESGAVLWPQPSPASGGSLP